MSYPFISLIRKEWLCQTISGQHLASSPISVALIGKVTPTPLGDSISPPGVTHESSSSCRLHTPWCDRGELKRFRLHSAGSTIPCLWPTSSSLGWPPSITTRRFSSNPPDSTSRWTPRPPKKNFRPAKNYPCFWIQTCSLRSDGTLTHPVHALPSAHYDLADSLLVFSPSSSFKLLRQYSLMENYIAAHK